MCKYKLPESLANDIDELEASINKYKKGEMNSDELKARRVPFGVYEQRESDTYMIRIRCAAGFVTPEQLEKVIELSSQYCMDKIHLTTRQELQIHYVKLDDIVTIIRELSKAGLASRGGGGNTIRNILAPEDAGINPEERFDVSPYAIALTSRLIAENDSWTLPRKFKIAFSGSDKDKGYATISDLGFIAQIKAGQKGFRVYAAGGLGTKSRTSNLLLDFIPEKEVYNIAKTLKNLFWKHGNRKNKYAARLRFLWEKLGEKEFRNKFAEEYETVKKENYSPLEVNSFSNTSIEATFQTVKIEDKRDFELWRKRFVNPQKQRDLYSINIPVELGFIKNEKALELVNSIKPFGNNVIRITKDQNFLIRNIPERYLTNFYDFLKTNQENFNRPFIYDKIISCTGASTCQLGICFSRNAARTIIQKLSKSNIALDNLYNLKINISGCPNACGQHPVADLGFFGKAGRVDGKLYPVYNIVAGAVVSESETRLAEKLGEISARDLPEFLTDFLKTYLDKAAKYKNFREYILSEGKSDVEFISGKYKNVPHFKEDKNYYYDWGAEKEFSLEGRGAGECSAGLFDLIEVDLKNINRLKKELEDIKPEDNIKRQELLKLMVFFASRMLLITRGVEPKTDVEVYHSFREHFIKTNLVSGKYEDLLTYALTEDNSNLLKNEQEIIDLTGEVVKLYESMDNLFQFNLNRETVKIRKETKHEATYIQRYLKDFRGVTCPMNFVKTKVELAKLKPRELLEILLDNGEPIENVPGSIRAEGHKIIEQKKIADYWSVIIERE